MPLLGTTIRLKNTIRDFDGTLIDPTSHDIKIYDSEGTEKDSETNPTKEETGIYYYDYTIPEDAATGEWRCVWIASKSEKPSKKVAKFSVSDPLKT